MRHDNDAMTRRDIRGQISNFVRTSLKTPRRAAAFGLLAAVGTGGLLAAAGPPAAHDAPATTAAPAAIAKAAAPSAKPAKAAAKTSVHRAANELRVKYQAQPNYYWCGPAATRNALSATGHNI